MTDLVDRRGRRRGYGGHLEGYIFGDALDEESNVRWYYTGPSRLDIGSYLVMSLSIVAVVAYFVTNLVLANH